jgi:YD repeat-containing protein
LNFSCPIGNHPIGRLTRFTDASGSTTLCFDHRGNVTRKTQVQGTVSLVTQWSYNAADRVTGIIYPSGKGVTLSRDALGRINAIQLTGGASIATGGTTLISNVLYEPFGPIQQISYGDGFAQTRSFDQNYWVQAITSTRPVGLQAYFDQDAVGNITGLSASAIGSGGGNGSDRTIDYDNLYRITEVYDRNAALIEAFSYDATGNRLSKTASNGVATGSYAYPAGSHRLESVNGVTRDFDAVGNLIEIQASAAQPGFEFDARNRLVESTLSNGGSTTLASYDYNGRGERVWHSGADPLLATDDLLYAYDESGRMLGEYAADGTPILETLWLDDLPIATLRGSTAYPIEPDHLGSPRVIAQGATLLWHWDLLGPVFGEHAPNDTASGTMRRGPGGMWRVIRLESGVGWRHTATFTQLH